MPKGCPDERRANSKTANFGNLPGQWNAKTVMQKGSLQVQPSLAFAAMHMAPFTQINATNRALPGVTVSNLADGRTRKDKANERGTSASCSASLLSTKAVCTTCGSKATTMDNVKTTVATYQRWLHCNTLSSESLTRWHQVCMQSQSNNMQSQIG